MGAAARHHIVCFVFFVLSALPLSGLACLFACDRLDAAATSAEAPHCPASATDDGPALSVAGGCFVDSALLTPTLARPSSSLQYEATLVTVLSPSMVNGTQSSASNAPAAAAPLQPPRGFLAPLRI
jgi:hypothetical protein